MINFGKCLFIVTLCFLISAWAMSFDAYASDMYPRTASVLNALDPTATSVSRKNLCKAVLRELRADTIKAANTMDVKLQNTVSFQNKVYAEKCLD